MSLLAASSSHSVDIESTHTPPHMQDDQWSDAHDETDDDVVEDTRQHENDLTVRAPKVAPLDKAHTINAPSPTGSSPTPVPEPEAEVSSVHSLPAVHVTEPASPTVPHTARSSTSVFSESARSNLVPPTPNSEARTHRHRSTTVEPRSSNRISGFFSSLIHRRDNGTPFVRESNVSPTPPPLPSPRASSPFPSRASTPPPSLPPPSLRDLGLCFSSVTSTLSPSHFSSPPVSGAFLAPHYLLLCHAQGLDVLPLVAPPAPTPYALIRRVAFKSIVVMEYRGVLVAIAGRRDGVRVYALEDVKRAIEWRMQSEVRREREKTQREEAKKSALIAMNVVQDQGNKRGSTDKHSRTKVQQSATPSSSGAKGQISRRTSESAVLQAQSPSTPRPPTSRKLKASTQPAPLPARSPSPPPAYANISPVRGRDTSIAPINASRPRTTSVSNVLAGTMHRRHQSSLDQENDEKGDWGSSDDEAINLVTAPSGSQALDERTSSMPTTTAPNSNAIMTVPRTQTSPQLQSTHAHRNRPANLDLSLSRSNTVTNMVPASVPPSPTPTLLSLRQNLISMPTSHGSLPTMSSLNNEDDNRASTIDDMDVDADEEEVDPAPSSSTTPTRERISLAEALFESRLSDIPPAGTQRDQEPILIGAHPIMAGGDAGLASSRTSESFSNITRRSVGDQSVRRRRRWSVLDGIFSPSQTPSQPVPSVPEGSDRDMVASPTDTTITQAQETQTQLTRSQSTRLVSSTTTTPYRASTSQRPSTASGAPELSSQTPVPPLPLSAVGSSRSRFLPRIITDAFHSRRSDDLPASPRNSEADSKKNVGTPAPIYAQAPKLEYVKLPGTKGSITVKAVETAKKSFLAILCGENGEKVELFAGTYRTALGLSRTFILPDSPRSLELQLQGDDLVEVFLVFSQNVFGLEPATVRVREVRIGRAERRAARRRAREGRSDNQGGENETTTAGDDDTSINVTVGVAATPTSAMSTMNDDQASIPSSAGLTGPSQAETASAAAASHTDELVTLAAAHMSPYSTFQQLSFAPNFPLASIADDYIIPPTYPSFLRYRADYEPDANGPSNVDLAQIQFTPPGLPVPVAAPPSKWFYRDPKGVVHGPWKASLMQAWYKDALLPPDLPVRREEDSEYTLLRDLRLQCIDPSHPFRSSSPSLPIASVVPVQDGTKPLLSPISLLAQPKHFGPPALFYSSRGGHSTTIVDARGRSVLKDRIIWSSDDTDGEMYNSGKLGEVKRLEALDVDDRAVLVAMRQGGLEAVDFGDALLKPADNSRTAYPHFYPPISAVNRRKPFVWKIGTPIIPGLPASAVNTKGHASRSQGKKQNTGSNKSPGRTDFSMGGDGDLELQDEVIFLGRRDDEIYLCERRSGSFRILRLGPGDGSS